MAQNTSTSFTVTVQGLNGWNAQINVSLSGVPSSIQASPSSFSLSAGGSQKVTLSAAASATLGNTAITVNASGGALSHSASCNLQILAGAAHLRIRYFDVAQDLTPDLNYNIQPHVLYHSPTKRFFFADALQNRILVYDAATELQIANITVPGAWALDQSPDGSTLYVGTQVGNIYLVDPVNMSVKSVIPANRIGPSGYSSYVVHPLADGRLALLGDQGGISDVEGYGSFAIWSPLDNSFAQYTTQYHASFGTAGQSVCGSLGSIAYLSVTPDRTKLMLGSAFSDSTVCRFDPDTTQFKTVTVPGSSAEATSVLQPPDGNEFLTSATGAIYVFNSSTMQLQDQFALSYTGMGPRSLLSLDGNTLYTISGATGAVLAYNWRTHALLGWASSPSVHGTFTDLGPMAVDETGLIAGFLGYGIGFADAGSLLSGTPQTFFGADARPSLGPTAGGTGVLFSGPYNGQTALNLYFGVDAGSNLSPGSSGLSATSPPHAAGPVDVTLQTTNGGLVSAFAGFSYGPSIRQILTQVSTAEGGATETIFGYGFGPAYSTTGAPSDLQVSIGGQNAQITAYQSVFRYSDRSVPTPLQMIQCALPPGYAGSSADLTISNSSGTATLKNAVSYVSAVQQFPLPGAQLFQGVYDPKRAVYYFTDQAQVRVFSLDKGWLASIPMPMPPSASSQRLVGISLSPDGTKLAVSDSAANVIYTLNPDVPSTIQTFALPRPDTSPCGLAVSDAGIVYYAAFDSNVIGAPGFYKLNLSTGTATAYPDFISSGGPKDIYIRVILSPDNRHVFYLEKGTNSVYMVDTATDAIQHPATASAEDYELALSPSQNSLAAGEWLFDNNLNLTATVADNALQAYDELSVYGEKFSADGSVLFRPLENSIEAVDGNTGVLRERISLPFTLSSNYDALVSDAHDNVLLAITGKNGDGVALIDLSVAADILPQSRIATMQASESTGVSMLVSGVSAATTGASTGKIGGLQLLRQRYFNHLPFSSAATSNASAQAAGETQTLQPAGQPAKATAVEEIGQQASQSISFASVSAGRVGDVVALAASATSGLPVTFVSKTPGVCAVTGESASLVGVGICFLQGIQPGNDEYAAALPVNGNFAVAPGSQTIAFDALPATGVYAAAEPYILHAIASSGLPVSFSVTGPATLSGSTLIITGVGTVVVTASQSGNSNYLNANPVSQTIGITAVQNTMPYTNSGN